MKKYYEGGDGGKINRLEVPVKQIIVGVGIKGIQQYLSCGQGDIRN